MYWLACQVWQVVVIFYFFEERKFVDKLFLKRDVMFGRVFRSVENFPVIFV
jgi:hypothetical protein